MTSNATIDPFSASCPNPLPCFLDWLAAACQLEPHNAEAMALATATPLGAPSVRMVLLKSVTPDGSFLFYTNAESRKGQELAANPRAAVCFYWKSLARQIRIEGSVTSVPAAEVDAYFHSRSRGSQLGALASSQSRVLEDRSILKTRQAELAERYPGEVPRPTYWQGYALRAEAIEFWSERPDRLHDRMLYRRTPSGWQHTLLYP